MKAIEFSTCVVFSFQIIVVAQDEGAGQNSLKNVETVNITLTDINDNAPFLDMPYPVVWDENQDPGRITKLEARDYDSDENGPPFIFKIDISADVTIISNFEIRGDELFARVTFDREDRKSYEIPVSITDSGRPNTQTGVSKLTVIIGDKNDNPMSDGSSSIFVYNYDGDSPDVEIGRVYVNDKDDMDLDDKEFSWENNQPEEWFSLNRDNGMITMKSGVVNGSYLLKFTVVEEGKIKFAHHYSTLLNNIR